MKIKKHLWLILIFAGLGLGAGACNSGDDDDDADGGGIYDPDISPEDFVSGIDNPYFPATPGEKWLYEGQTEDGLEQIMVEVLATTKEVWGVEAVVIRDTVYLDGELAEDTRDWFAQDTEGNVWYLGEDTYEYEDDEIVSAEGAWEAGVDGALPGIVMPGSPALDQGPYYQEFYAGEAEDMGEIISLDEAVDVPAGSFTGCIKTRDTTALEPDIEEFKYYCAGIGVVLEEEEDTRIELVSHTNDAYDPGIEAADLGRTVANPYFPLTVGASWVYESDTDEGTERIEVEVLAETKTVWGVEAIVVRDTAYLDDEMIEDTWDWYATDATGNFWYLGEETYEYEDGEQVSTEGAWESGVDGALPGIVMLGSPAVGQSYFEEYYIGVAEDVGEVVAVDEDVTTPAGSWTGCVKTRETSAINPTIEEFKYWCAGVGLVLETEDDVRVELISYSGL